MKATSEGLILTGETTTHWARLEALDIYDLSTTCPVWRDWSDTTDKIYKTPKLAQATLSTITANCLCPIWTEGLLGLWLLAECLPDIHKALGSLPQHSEKRKIEIEIWSTSGKEQPTCILCIRLKHSWSPTASRQAPWSSWQLQHQSFRTTRTCWASAFIVIVTAFAHMCIYSFHKLLCFKSWSAQELKY